MPQQNLDRARTFHGVGHLEDLPHEDPPSGGGSREPSFVPIGARVGRSGHVFETDGDAGPGSLVVKLFTWGAGLPDEVVQDFTREALAVASVRHPHIAQVVDVGRLGDGTPFVVMERLAGLTLEEEAAGRPLPSADVLGILRGVGSALSAAHAAGVAHGGVRADNVFIAEPASSGPRWPMLLDFGVARLVSGASAGALPRLELDGRAGARADQLALAAMAWRLLGGESSPAVQRVLLRAMSPDPSRRFSTVATFVDAVEEAFAQATAAGLAANAAAVTTLVRGALPAPSSRPTVAAAPDHLAVASPAAPAAAKPTAVAPAPAVAAAPSSLTQQFFAEGEQMEEAHAAGRANDAGADGEEDDADDDGPSHAAAAAASRVPRSRAQMAAAALLALGSVALISWTVVSLADEPTGDPRPAAAPAIAPARPVAASPARARPPAAAIDRAPRVTAAQARRAPRVHPPPFPAASTPSVTTSTVTTSLVTTPAVTTLEAPRPWIGPVPPAEVTPPATPDPAPSGAAAAPVEVPAPPPAATSPAEAAPRDSEPTKPFPDVAPTTSSGAATETQQPNDPASPASPGNQ